jgi:hypothetical protein
MMASNVPNSHNGKPLIHSWTYCAKDGAPFGVVGRYQNGDGKKDIVPFFKLSVSGWLAGIDLNPRPLFGLETLVAGKAVFITEGEKSAAALQGLGIGAITSLGGAQAAGKSDWTPLSGYHTAYILPDNDTAGEHYAQSVVEMLMALESPPTVKMLRLEGLPESGDIVDWLQCFPCLKDWDGYQPINPLWHDELKEALKLELPKAVHPEQSKQSKQSKPTLAGLAGEGVSVFEWEKPNIIESTTPPVQPLLPEMIPAPFRYWLDDVSHRMQSPPDFSAISSLVVVGSLIGAGCAIRPKQYDDFEVIPNVWGACIARPSVLLKSPCMKEATGLLERLQAEYSKQYDTEKSGAEFDTLANKAMMDDVKGQISKAAKGTGKDRVVSPDDIQKLKADFMELSENTGPEPTRRLFKTNETSIQSMTLLQTQNPRGLLVFRDELTGLLVKWDRDDGADERAYFLEGWNGNGSYTDCKIGRGITDAKNICISLLGGIQPDKLRRYLYQALQGNNDGMMQRLQLAVWPDEPESWQLVDTLPNKAEKQRAYGIIKTLAELDFIEYGASQGEYDERPYFRFDDDGQAVFNAWLTDLQTVKLKQEDNPLMVEHFGKFRSLMPSLALIFHCIDIADNRARSNVSAKSARLAVQWCGYLESHARRIYAMAESPEHEAAVRLTEKIRARALPSPFTIKTVYDKGWHGLKDKQEVMTACNVLIEENWLKMTRKPKASTGRPPLPEYFINPFFL